MDRTAWIVCTLCVIGLVMHFTLLEKPVQPPKQPATPTSPGTSGEGGTGTGTGTPGDGGTETPTEPAVPPKPEVEEQLFVLKTPRAEFTMTNLGGGVKSAKMLDAPDEFVLNGNGKGPVGAFHSEMGFAGKDAYAVVDSSDTHVVYETVTERNLKVRKTFRLAGEDEGGGEKGGRDFLLKLEVELTGPSDSIHEGTYFVYTGASSPVTSDEIDLYRSFFWNDGGDVDYETVSYFSGGMFSDPTPEFAAHFENLRWAGVMNQFYATIFSAAGEGANGAEGKMWARRYQEKFKAHTSKVSENPDELNERGEPPVSKWVVHAGVGLPPVELQPGASISHQFEIFMGPKEYQRLAKLGEERREVMFYGWFSVISRTLVNSLTWVRGWFPNNAWGWGWAVVIVTIMLRILMWPLHAKSTRMSKRMGLLAPMMKELKEKYKDNPQKMNQETMKLYREYGVNPIGGCLPLLFQIPIFFGFYRMLQYAAELRGQEWLWVKDLSAPDTVAYMAGIPINPLPILMTVTMFLQMQMMPKTGDKMQRRIFMLMPVMFLWFCYNFASALPLYWTVQNIFGIGQTWLMKRMGTDIKLVKREAPTRVPPTQPGQKPKKKKAQVTRTGGKAKSAGKKKRSER